MKEFDLLDPSHIIFALICIAIIIFLPRLFVGKSDISKNILISAIIGLMLVNHGMDFYKEGYLVLWKLGLPLHLCDFSSASIILYLITKKRAFFLFAFFAGFSGAGMAILTPDSTYAFPDIHYVRHMIGHAMILLGVTYAMIVDGQRPYIRDVHRVLFVLSMFLVVIYIINYFLGPPANYWYVAEKPPGLNVTSLMRDEPYHMVDIYLLAVFVCYLIYLPYFIQDKMQQK